MDLRVGLEILSANCPGDGGAEIASALNCGTTAILSFAKKPDIDLDWLICGDLEGLLLTVRARRISA
jgi:hypothetical protein